MTFTPGIPTTGDTLGSTRDDIRNNFGNYFATMSVNHVPPNGGSGFPQGKHTFAEFVAQGSDPATALNEITLYGKTTTPGNTELFIRKDNNGVVYQLTKGVPVTSTPGYVYLPGGILMQWATASCSPGGTLNNFPIAFPTAFFVLTFTPIGGTPFTTSYNIISTSQFRAFSSGGVSMTYIAIGN